MTLLLVLVGGAVGAPLRYLTDLVVQSRHDSVFPWGTLTVNVVGSAVLGWILAAASLGQLSPEMVALLGTGLCGALTTFSTFGYETVRLLQEGSTLEAGLNVVVSLVAGYLAAAGAWSATVWLLGA
ncbi:chromosome condensation protein CrcB [Intrasporangium oryzae NRRL B-24470]|uniref:Fluoride-specific ion channel FluC n=1 Tax=Intrasporangium oryzae NRRL B-24470 TaxID=1386089 RepID=W9G785_9MICO|nr:fluoride efflux transporter CrcB [Intrasporangium oryzae]EWT01900.1 chromosome condensation protein CrcB [Intrasporangium oryzae NRRL B-24470]